MIRFTTVTWYSQIVAILLAIAIFSLGIFIGFKLHEPEVTVVSTVATDTPDDEPTLPEVTDRRSVTSFEWMLNTSEPNGDYPRTLVALKFSLADGTSEDIQLDIVDGTCNEMPTETKLALDSKQLICYYAGFGYQYRVIAEGGSYAVQRKEIEEASPDYNPPPANFETVLQISTKGEVDLQ